MGYIYEDELKEILPGILSPWIDDEGDLECIFNEIEQKCHIGKKKKDKKKQKQYTEYNIDALESKIDAHSTVLSAFRCDINVLKKRVDELSTKVSNLSSSNISITGKIDALSRDITAAKSMAQTAKQRTEVDYTKCTDGYFTEAQVAQHIYNRMANRGATREELDSFREVVKKYDATSYSWNKEKTCETCKHDKGLVFLKPPCNECNIIGGLGTDKWEAKDE